MRKREISHLNIFNNSQKLILFFSLDVKSHIQLYCSKNISYLFKLRCVCLCLSGSPWRNFTQLKSLSEIFYVNTHNKRVRLLYRIKLWFISCTLNTMETVELSIYLQYFNAVEMCVITNNKKIYPPLFVEPSNKKIN